MGESPGGLLLPKRDIIQMEKGRTHNNTIQNILGQSPEMLKAKELAIRVADTQTTVLLTGETGTGKEVFAQAIHQDSNRATKPFVAVNCSSFSDQLLQSELFGHVAGAFTGAGKDKNGLFEEANGGTLFLDEIGEMNMELQARLLRVLENGTFHKLGDAQPTVVNTRIIAATHRDLKSAAESGLFRRDLYYRLSVFTIHLPPLRERKEDMPALANYFIAEFSRKHNKRVTKMDEHFLRSLHSNAWRGNIRELRNMIERVVILSDKDILTADLLPVEFFREQVDNGGTLDLAANEDQFIRKALQQTKGNKSEAARLLGIGLSTLYRKINDYQIYGY